MCNIYTGTISINLFIISLLVPHISWLKEVSDLIWQPKKPLQPLQILNLAQPPMQSGVQVLSKLGTSLRHRPSSKEGTTRNLENRSTARCKCVPKNSSSSSRATSRMVPVKARSCPAVWKIGWFLIRVLHVGRVWRPKNASDPCKNCGTGRTQEGSG